MYPSLDLVQDMGIARALRDSKMVGVVGFECVLGQTSVGAALAA